MQFVAIALAILRPDVTIAGAYLDQWAMLVAAVVTAWSGSTTSCASRPRCAAAPDGRASSSPGGSGVIGRRARRAARGARRQGRRARPFGRGRGRRWRERGARSRPRRDCSTRTASRGRWRARGWSTTWPGSTSSASRDPAPMHRANVDGAATAVRAAARAEVARLVHTSSAATLGEATGTVGSEASPHRGWFLSTTSAPRPRARRPCWRRPARTGIDGGVRQPVLGPGAGAGRRHRPLPAGVRRRAPEGLRGHEHQPRRHRRLRRGPPAGGASAARPASATCSTG